MIRCWHTADDIRDPATVASPLLTNPTSALKISLYFDVPRPAVWCISKFWVQQQTEHKQFEPPVLLFLLAVETSMWTNMPPCGSQPPRRHGNSLIRPTRLPATRSRPTAPSYCGWNLPATEPWNRRAKSMHKNNIQWNGPARDASVALSSRNGKSRGVQVPRAVPNFEPGCTQNPTTTDIYIYIYTAFTQARVCVGGG